MKKATILLTAAAMLLFSCGEKLAGSSGGGQVANAVIITLRSWQTQATDTFGTSRDLDPRIYFIVRSRSGTSTLSTNNTTDLLNVDNIGQSWSGSRSSGAVSIHASADQLRIEAVVIERDPLASDDISPSNVLNLSLPQYVGRLSGQSLGSSTTSQSRVTFDLEFVRR